MQHYTAKISYADNECISCIILYTLDLERP